MNRFIKILSLLIIMFFLTIFFSRYTNYNQNTNTYSNEMNNNAESKYCIHCGKEVKIGAKYCSNCGNEII